MNKKLEEYKKKSNRIINTFKLLGISIFLLGVLISIVQYVMNKAKSEEMNQQIDSESAEYKIDLLDNTVIYENEFDINIEIEKFNEDNNYKICINSNGVQVINQELINEKNKVTVQLEDEGEKNIDIIIYKNDEENYENNLDIYYVEPYRKQFLDEFSNCSVSTHFGLVYNADSIEQSIQLLEGLGIKNVRDSIRWEKVINEEGKFDFSSIDTWYNRLKEKNINLFAILFGSAKEQLGDDNIVSNDSELVEYGDYVEKVISQYPDISMVEVWNEPNKLLYTTDEQIEWYAKVISKTNEILKSKNEKIKIYSGVTMVPYQRETESSDYLKKISQYGAYKNSDGLSYHPYTELESMERLIYMNDIHIKAMNDLGGFINEYASEYGINSQDSMDEDIRARRIIKQTVTNENQGIKFSNYYTFRDTDDTSRYGLVDNDYTPKPSYYSMKNYYQNTNGSEYIGTLDIEDGLEAHVYDKDGKPLIIAWSDNTDNTYDFTLGEMTAKDIYGKDITPDESGNIQITTSPVYLYNVGNHYFYQAISNTVTQKYDEFTSNFSGEIAKVSGLQASIDNLKQKIQDISSNSTLDETTAINLMEQHYNLGNTIIQAYKSGNLQVEYVKLSSMLDMLDDIGDSFEDLVTVSAKTRNVDLTDTLNSITNAGNLINDSDIEMVYPTKILEFSQDFYDKANYINGLEEENDIKTGLIVSKNLHSKLLANWATEFANLYVDEYIANNPVEIEYSTIDYTNQDVTATLKTNANITVTNNSNSKTYTFNQNGSFTFEYTIKGRAFTKTATVSNIDKAAPTVTGVENDKLYLDSITPQIQDENLQEVKLYKDNNEVQNYQTNTTISEDGNYKIVAIDKASNQIETTFYISRNPATIGYSTTDLTNQDVIATVNSNFDVEVLNNSNQNTYRFNQNGEFTFEIKIKGTSLNLTATVNNIDKTLPVITGVEENKQYIDKATPMVTDENLNEVKLYLNSYLEEGYVPGTELTEEGFYRLVANDKAGNEITVEFRIMENISEEYIRQGSYIINIKNNTTTSAFDQKIDMGLDYKILRDGNPLTENDIIATGDILRTSAGEELTLIVSGDINKDGDVNIKDIVKLRKYLLVRNNLDELELIAADCNIDGRSISIKDLIRMRLIVLERGVT